MHEGSARRQFSVGRFGDAICRSGAGVSSRDARRCAHAWDCRAQASRSRRWPDDGVATVAVQGWQSRMDAMATYEVEVRITPWEEGGYLAEAVGLQDCWGIADTVDQAIDDIL